MPASGRSAPTSTWSTTWVARRFPVYARACLLAVLFVAPVAMNLGALNVFMLVKVTSIWVFGVIALGLWAVWSAERHEGLPPTRWARVAAAFLAACVLATVTSTNPILSLVGIYQRYGGLLPLLLYASVAMVIVGLYWRHPDAVGQLAWAVTAGTAVLVGYVLIQAAGLDWMGWTDPETGQPPSYPGGTIGNSNFAGGYLAIALPLVLYTALAPSSRRVRTALLAVFGLTALALWCTQTRGGMAGAAAATTTLALLYRHRIPRWLRRAAAGGLAALALATVLAVWHPGTDEPPGPLSTLHVFSSNTLSLRVNYWYAAGQIFADHPVLGTGPDTFFDHYTSHRLPEDGRQHGGVVPQKPHNIFFEYAANAGAAGLLTYLAMVGVALRAGWRRARRLAGRQRLLVACFVASLVAYLVQGFFSIDVPPLALMGWVCLGALAVLADPKLTAARQAALPPAGPEGP
ncbi:MAG: O-antigen ligase family protein, partial [Acidimicrobiales bacterium]